MLDQKSLRDNAPRIAAFFVVCVTLVFDIKSIVSAENSRSHENYDIANSVAPVAGILNVFGRVLDHWNNPEKQKNIKMAVPLVPLLLTQLCFSALSATHQFEQPIALPTLIGSFCLLFFTGLNWEPVSDELENHCIVRMKKNAGRIGGIGFSIMSAGAASASMAFNSKTLFFAGLTANSLGSTAESLSRVLDITYFEKEKTTLLNKVAVIFFFGLVLTGALLSGFATAGVWNQPIDLASTLFRIHMLFYMLAQYKSSELQESALLLPESEKEEEKSSVFVLPIN